MEVRNGRIPPGPQEKYRATDDLLDWMSRQFRTFGDIYKATVYGTSMYATRDVEFAHHVLVENWQNYVKGQGIQRVALLLGNGLMVSKGDLWKRQRRMIQPAFNHESIGRIDKSDYRRQYGTPQKMATGGSGKRKCQCYARRSSMALEIVLRFIFGRRLRGGPLPFRSSLPGTSAQYGICISFRALGKVILQVIDRRRKDAVASTDVLAMLMQARNPQGAKPMADTQLVDEILTLIVAGHETTASTLNWAWYLISQHPEVEQKLSEELNVLTTFSEFGDLPKFLYTRQVIDEVMRLYPAGWLVTRRALHDDQLGEYFVPAGTEIYIPPYFIQRHPDLWEEPDRFDPDRFRPENSLHRHRLATIPFSVGPRNCIGAVFARIEMQIHVMTIARHLRLRYVQSGPIEFEAGVNLRSKHDFIMYPEIKMDENSEAAVSQVRR